MTRPSIKSPFVLKDKRLRVYFVTSNIEKYLHARLVFQRYGLLLRDFRSIYEYSEDYEGDSQRLLDSAIDQVTRAVGGALVFVEDTSVRIEALSTPDRERPGLRVKEWFRDTSFEELDHALTQAGDRTATVRSDIALHVPGLDRPVYFHGETKGTVAESPPDFDPSPRHPWLTPYSFNGWFVPAGCTKPLGAMAFEESWAVDFRTRALTSLLERLEEYSAALNLPPGAYAVHRPRTVEVDVPRLFASPEHQLLLVLGMPAAGKTTMGERLSERFDCRFVEASHIMAELKHDRVAGGDDEDVAVQAVMAQQGADVVAHRILEILNRDRHLPAVITGLRTPEEMEVFMTRGPQPTIIYIEASTRTRFERYLERGRYPEGKTYEEFLEWNQRQELYGLLPVARYFADIEVANEVSLEEYLDLVDQIGAGLIGGSVIDVDSLPGVSRKPRGHDPEKSQLVRSLHLLDSAGRPMNTEEIEEESAALGSRIRHNNANKVLKQYPGLVRRIETPGHRLRYQILDAGRAFLRILEDLESGPGADGAI